MQISYISPLSSAWNRMMKSLFRPFHIKKWFILGFSAFLAGLLDWESGGSDDKIKSHFNFDEFMRLPQEAKEWLNNNPEWFALIVAGIIVIVILVVVLTWLSSRGKFMFLDNVVHDRALIKQPWAQFKTVGNSLFMWRLGYGIVCIIIFSAYFSYIYLEIYDMYEQYASDMDMIIAALKMGSFFVIMLIIAAYISLFLEDFVVPIMYKNNSRAWIGWSSFMTLFSSNFIYFMLYGLLVFLLFTCVVIIVIVFGIITCCLGFGLLMIPYIGSVLFLPVTVTFRALSLEFLGQFGEEYKLFTDETAE